MLLGIDAGFDGTPAGYSKGRVMIKLRAELKCYLCGRTAGELEGVVGREPRFQSFRPAPGMQSLVGMQLSKARCARCGGGLFVDEVERIYFVSERPLKPEKRGRKPRRRTVAA